MFNRIKYWLRLYWCATLYFFKKYKIHSKKKSMFEAAEKGSYSIEYYNKSIISPYLSKDGD